MAKQVCVNLFGVQSPLNSQAGMSIRWSDEDVIRAVGVYESCTHIHYTFGLHGSTDGKEEQPEQRNNNVPSVLGNGIFYGFFLFQATMFHPHCC